MEEKKEQFDILVRWKLKMLDKAERAKKAVKRAVKKTVDFVHDNPEFSVAIATVTIPTALKMGRMVSNTVDERHRKLRTYDRRTDEYLRLRRQLKPWEQEELANRMERGETKTMILRDLGLLR